jgi:tetratricopeptide (TPR) repeat protein
MTSFKQADISIIVEKAESARLQDGWQQCCEILREGLQTYPDSVLLMVKLGKALRLCDRFAEAEEILRQAQSVAPDDYEVLYQLGIVLRQESQIWEALAIHSHLVEKFPGDPDARHVLANSRIVLGRVDLALPELDQLISQFPDRINYHISYSRALNRMGRYTESIATINEVLKHKPYAVDPLLCLAEANQKLIRSDQWIAAALKAYQFVPNRAVVRLWMHQVCLEEGKFEEAFDHLRKALEIHPRFFQAHVAVGSFYWNAKREDLAHRWFESAYQIAPWDGYAQGMLAQFQAETGRGVPDLERLQSEALALPYGRLPYYLGRMFFSTYQDYDRALQFLKVAVDCAPEDVDARRILGLTYIKRDEYDNGIDELRHVLDLCPQLSNAYEELAYACLQAGRLSEAETAYVRAIARLPQKADVRHGYGITLLRLGQTENALSQLQQAVQLEPEDGDMLYSLAETLLNADKPKEALEVALKAKALLPEDDEDIEELLEHLQTST